MSLNTRIKRTKELREEYIQQDGLIFGLPDEILLKIFQHFTTAERILAASVCKWFRLISNDDHFWKTIDLTPKFYSSRSLVKFVHRFPRNCTEILKISGGSLQNNSGKPPPFSEQLNSLIRISYPNLLHLYLSQYDFHPNQRNVKSIISLPSNLQGLYLLKCDMLAKNLSGTLAFLQIPKNSKSNFQQLEILSFENSSCLTAESVGYLPDLCPKLHELNLNGCFRITSKARIFTDTLVLYGETLRRLYLSGTQTNDDTIHTICRKLKRLNVLNIKHCKLITKNIVDNLLTLKQLQKLIADDDVQNLYEQRKNEGN